MADPIAAAIDPLDVWISALNALADHETGCNRCWGYSVARCDDGARLLGEEQAAYVVLYEVRNASLDGEPCS